MQSKGLRTAWILFGLAVGAVLIVQGWRFMTRDMIDFSVIYRVGERVLAGEAIYDFGDDIMLFKYAPAIAFLLTPFALIPKNPSAFVFFMLSVLSFAAVYRISYRWLVPQGTTGWPAFFIVFLTVLTTLRVVMNSLDFGQVQVFLLLGMLFCYRCFAQGRHWRGSAVLSLLVMSKIVPGVLALPWLLRKQWRPAAYTGVCCLGLLFFPVLLLGPQVAFNLSREWLDLLFVSTNQSMIERWTNQSLLSGLARVLADNHYHVNIFDWDMRHVILLTNAILGIWLAALLWRARRLGSGASEFSHFLLLIILAFPLAWRYHFTSLIIPNTLLLSHLIAQKKNDYWLWGLFAGAFALTSGVNQELLSSEMFEWFYLRSCLAVAVGLTLLALLRLDFLAPARQDAGR